VPARLTKQDQGPVFVRAKRARHAALERVKAREVATHLGGQIFSQRHLKGHLLLDFLTEAGASAVLLVPGDLVALLAANVDADEWHQVQFALIDAIQAHGMQVHVHGAIAVVPPARHEDVNVA
jgi:hypothetical protein